MKEYRLVSWPQLSAPFDRIAYRRILNEMSHRHMTLAQLAEGSGVRRQQVRAFLDMLDSKTLLNERDAPADDSLLGSLRPLGGWIRRAISSGQSQR
jgi:hypothetical protein